MGRVHPAWPREPTARRSASGLDRNEALLPTAASFLHGPHHSALLEPHEHVAAGLGPLPYLSRSSTTYGARASHGLSTRNSLPAMISSLSPKARAQSKANRTAFLRAGFATALRSLTHVPTPRNRPLEPGN